MFKKILVCLILTAAVALTGTSYAKDNSMKDARSSGFLTVGMDTAELPWVKQDKTTGKYEGFEYELMNLIAKRMGLKLKVVYSHWNELGQNLLDKKFDIIANAYSPNDVDKKIKESIVWSDPYYNWGWAIAVRSNDNSINGINDLKGKKVGCFTDGEEYFSKIRGIKKLIVYKKAAYDQLLAKKIDAFIYDSPSVYYAVKNNPKIKVAGPVIEKIKQYDLGFRKEDVALRKAVNKTLRSIIKSKEYKKIVEKWL